MTSRKLDAFFSETGSPLGRLARVAQRLNAISRIWETIAPSGLAHYCRVGRLENGVLTLLADNGAVASKIKQQLPSLLDKFQRRRVEITGIRVEVQVKIPLSETRRAPKSGISPRSLSSLEKLDSELQDSPLKEALTNLIKRQRGSI